MLSECNSAGHHHIGTTAHPAWALLCRQGMAGVDKSKSLLGTILRRWSISHISQVAQVSVSQCFSGSLKPALLTSDVAVDPSAVGWADAAVGATTQSFPTSHSAVMAILYYTRLAGVDSTSMSKLAQAVLRTSGHFNATGAICLLSGRIICWRTCAELRLKMPQLQYNSFEITHLQSFTYVSNQIYHFISFPCYVFNMWNSNQDPGV